MVITVHGTFGKKAPWIPRQRDAAREVLGVVTLGTPFLHAEMRKGEGPLGVIEADGAPAIVALLFSVLSIPFAVALSIGLLPCGWTLPLAGPYLDIAAEPAPPGTWKVTQLSPENSGAALSHGKAHDDADVFAEVSKWILERAVVVDKGRIA